MKIDFNKLLASQPKKRVMALTNHIAEVGMLFGKGFLTPEEVTELVGSFRSDKELKIYEQHKKWLEIAQNFMAAINQNSLYYRADLCLLDKLVIVKNTRDEMAKIQEVSGKDIKDLVNNSTIGQLCKYSSFNRTLDGNLIDGFKERLKKQQVNIKSGIKAFKDALKEHSFKVKALENIINGIEESNKTSWQKKWLYSLEIELTNYDSIPIEQDQYDKYRKEHF